MVQCCSTHEKLFLTATTYSEPWLTQNTQCDLEPELSGYAKALVAEGHLIYAIKFTRTRTGLGLPAAKALVDAYRAHPDLRLRQLERENGELSMRCEELSREALRIEPWMRRIADRIDTAQYTDSGLPYNAIALLEPMFEAVVDMVAAKRKLRLAKADLARMLTKV